MPIPISLFDPELIAPAWFDHELNPLAWFDSELASSAAVVIRGWFPTGCSNDAGDVIKARFFYDSGATGPGKILFTFKGSGDHSFGSVLTAKDSTGTALEFLATSFHIRFAKDGAARVILTAVINGETDVSSWWSTDVASGGGTFTRFS